MGLAYLIDPLHQFQNDAGVNNVHGFIRVLYAGTDDVATTYKDFVGTLNPEHIPIDNDGRAVIIVDSTRAYRVEMYLPNGALKFTQEPVYPVAGGGGGTAGIHIESSDGSISVEKTAEGGITTFDLSVSADDPQYTGWAKCALANEPAVGTLIPLKVQGTLEADDHGIVLRAGELYHVTARFMATKDDAAPFYDEISLMFRTYDGETFATALTSKRIIDYSLGLSQEFDISGDIKVGDQDVSLSFAYGGQDENAGEVRFLTADIHKLNSGVPSLPGGIATRDWVSENYQEKLEAGSGITIEGNVISATASQQQQADWAENDPEDVTFIRNKPNLAAVATSGSYNDLSDKPSIPDPQVQSDWSEADNAKPDFIKNKPNLATVATSGSYNDLSDKPDIPSQQEQANWTEQDSSKPSFIKNKPNLAAVATSGSYNDLSDKPSIPAAQVQSDWMEADSGAVDYIKNKPNLAAVATSGSYSDLSNKPTIPAAQVNSDWNASSGVSEILNKPNLATVATSGSYNDLQNKPNLAAVATSGSYTDLSNKPNLAAVATSGSYNDLSDKPSIPAAQVNADWNSSSGVSEILNKPNLATVATSGSYSDLSNKPTIPAAQVNSDWNASSGVAEILNKPNLATVATSGSYTDLSDKPSIPAAQVQSDWSQSDNAAVDFIKNKPNIPSIPPMKDLVAGTNVTITETNNGIEIAASGYTAGDGIDITNNVISWLNTAGITDIEEVNALPASPDPHTLYLTPDSGAQETVLYSGMKSIGSDGAATYTLSESPLNFEYIRVYYCASSNKTSSDWGTGGNVGVESVEWDTNLYRANNTHLHVQMNGATGTTFTQYNVSANLSDIRTPTWTVQGALNAATSNAAFFHIYKIVGRNRIANN